MSTEENKAVVRRFIHDGMIGGNLAVIDELCSPECVNHAAVPEARYGADGVKRVVTHSRAAMPDQRWTNEMIVAEGDLVVIHGVREATWQAENFRGIATPKGNASPWSSFTSSAFATGRSSSIGPYATTSGS